MARWPTSRKGTAPLRPDHVLSDRPALAAVTTLLCDADGNLFPSEEPAFDASVGVTNRFLAAIGSGRRYTVDRLRRESLGRNFRSLAASLASDHGVPVSPEDLQAWVDEENAVVTRHLAAVLLPDSAATAALRELAGRYRLAVVSSSALARLDACFSATGLDELFPAGRRFSAEEAVAVEDAAAGVASAVGAGIATIGNVVHVPAAERAAREEELRAAGATAVVGDWRGLVDLLSPQLDRSVR